MRSFESKIDDLSLDSIPLEEELCQIGLVFEIDSFDDKVIKVYVSLDSSVTVVSINLSKFRSILRRILYTVIYLLFTYEISMS